MTMTQEADRSLTSAEEAFARSMYEGMAQRAGLTGLLLDIEAVYRLSKEVERLPDDHLVQRWLAQQPVDEAAKREIHDAFRRTIHEEVEKHLAEQVATGRLERHPTDPERYRFPQPSGTPWE